METYHVTTTAALSSIMTSGLVPQVGPRSEMLNEGAAVFLFPDQDSMYDALGSWLVEEFEDEDELVALRVTVDPTTLVKSSVDWEVMSLDIIPPQNIEVIGLI